MISYAKISENEFKKRIKNLVESEFQRRFSGFSKNLEQQVGYVLDTSMTDEMYQDLSVLRIGLDNIDTEDYDGVGFQTLNDFHYFGVVANSDDEQPVYFIIYVDNYDNLRVYLPTEGNNYDVQTNSTFGTKFLDEMDDFVDCFDILAINKHIKKQII